MLNAYDDYLKLQQNWLLEMTSIEASTMLKSTSYKSAFFTLKNLLRSNLTKLYAENTGFFYPKLWLHSTGYIA
jgi:hypothetical protein